MKTNESFCSDILEPFRAVAIDETFIFELNKGEMKIKRGMDSSLYLTVLVPTITSGSWTFRT